MEQINGKIHKLNGKMNGKLYINPMICLPVENIKKKKYYNILKIKYKQIIYIINILFKWLNIQFMDS